MATSKKPITYFAHLEVSDVFRELGTSEKGLTQSEVDHRLAVYGLNTLVTEKRSSVFFEFFSNFKNPLILILLAAALVSFALGEHVDALIIFSIVFLSVILNFFQEYSANKAAQKLKEHLALKATVFRGGKEYDVHSTHICVGDILVLNAGDLVPADARIVWSKDFFVNQSSLTGESYPVEKHSEVSSNTGDSLSDLRTVVFSGSNVVSGTAHAVVVRIGAHTEFGKISSRLTDQQLDSDFNKGVGHFSLLILRVTIFLWFLFSFLILLPVKILYRLCFFLWRLRLV